MAPRSAAGRFRFHAAPGAPGQAGRCEDGRYIVGGERIGLAAAPARRLASEALQNAAHAIMAGRIGGAGVDVAGADRGADRAHGGSGAAIAQPARQGRRRLPADRRAGWRVRSTPTIPARPRAAVSATPV